MHLRNVRVPLCPLIAPVAWLITPWSPVFAVELIHLRNETHAQHRAFPHRQTNQHAAFGLAFGLADGVDMRWSPRNIIGNAPQSDMVNSSPSQIHQFVGQLEEVGPVFLQTIVNIVYAYKYIWYMCLFVYWFIHSFDYLFIYWFIYLFISLFTYWHLFMYLTIYLVIYLVSFIYLSTYFYVLYLFNLFIYIFHVSICLFVCLYIYSLYIYIYILFIYSSYLCICLSICLFTYSSLSLSLQSFISVIMYVM